MSYGQSAGVYPKVTDEVGAAQLPSTNVVGLVMIAPNKVFLKKPMYITGGSEELVETFGKAQVGFENYVAAKLIADTTSCWVVNVGYQESGSDVNATVNLEDSESTPLVKVDYVAPGEIGNDYSINVTKSSTGLFSFVVNDKDGNPLEKFENISFNKFSLSYVNNVYSQYVKLTAQVEATEQSEVAVKSYQLATGESRKITYTEGDITDAIKMLSDEGKYNINMITVPCLSHKVNILTALNTACDETKAMKGFVAPPKDVSKAADVVSWTNGTLPDSRGETYPKNSINNSQISVHAPWVKVFDSDINSSVWVSPECEVIAARVLTNDNYQPWFANAGTSRGKVKRATELAVLYNEGDRDLLYGGTNIVNPICKIGNYGFLIWGQKTSLRDTTKQLTRENVRYLQNYIYNMIMPATQEFVFEQNDQYTWDSWIGMAEGVMKSIKEARGVYDYKVTMQPTDEEIDRYEMPGVIAFKPTKTAEFIEVNFVLKSKGADL